MLMIHLMIQANLNLALLADGALGHEHRGAGMPRGDTIEFDTPTHGRSAGIVSAATRSGVLLSASPALVS